MKEGDRIILLVPTQFGPVEVSFKIVKELGDKAYLLLGQGRLIVARLNVFENAMVISKPIDLLSNIDLDNKVCTIVKSE